MRAHAGHHAPGCRARRGPFRLTLAGMRAVAEIGVLTASAAFGGVQTFAGKAAVSTISAPRGVRSDRTRSRALRLRPAAEAADSLKQAGIHAEFAPISSTIWTKHRRGSSCSRRTAAVACDVAGRRTVSCRLFNSERYCSRSLKPHRFSEIQSPLSGAESLVSQAIGDGGACKVAAGERKRRRINTHRTSFGWPWCRTFSSAPTSRGCGPSED